MAVVSSFIIQELQQLCQEFNVKELYLFGSAVSDNFSHDSDLDFIVNFDRTGFAGAFDQFIDLSNGLNKYTVVRSIYTIKRSSEMQYFNKRLIVLKN